MKRISRRAEELIEEFIASLSVGYEELISQPTLIGVQDLAASEIVLQGNRGDNASNAMGFCSEVS